tara:strand:- start:656 stop:2830 length:2175 start_codon:yes stop_codon:yes gene_type:complete
MSLTLPSAYSSALEKTIIKENWIIQLYYDGGSSFTPIALSDTTVNSVFYQGVITNRPSVRTSISLEQSKAKTSNMSLTIANFKYNNVDFSAELFLGTRKYINRTVRVYSQLNDESSLSNCLQIYEGRLIDISHDDKIVNLNITEQRPYDFISIPQARTNRTKNYYTLAYGDYTPNNSTRNSQAFCHEKKLYPVRVDRLSATHLIAIQERALDGNSGNEGRLHYYEKNADAFVPLTLENNTFNNISISTHDPNGNAIRIDNDLYRGFICKPTGLSDENDSSAWNNLGDAFDVVGDDSSYSSGARETLQRTNNGTFNSPIFFDVPEIEGEISSMKMKVRYRLDVDLQVGGNADYTVSFTNETPTSFGGSNQMIKQIDESSATQDTGNVISSLLDMDSFLSTNDNKLLTPIKLNIQLVYSSGFGSVTADIYIYDVHIYVKSALDILGNRDASLKIANDIEYLYVGANGLTESYSGSNNSIAYGHEAHRDLLVRYTGYTTTDPENWSSLDTDRVTSNWKIRYWLDKPTDLIKILDKLAYEFAFIFKFRPDGTGSYVHIKQTSELSAVQTLNKDDIKNLNITNTSFRNLITKMEINFQRHPADGKYLETVTGTNSTARTNFNIQTKENIKKVDLDMNVGTPSTTPQSDPNNDFYSYYDNILGDIYKQVSCEIVNPNKGYNLETGDIIQFSNTAGDMPINPFGGDWTNYYMITQLNRLPNKVNIVAREVG